MFPENVDLKNWIAFMFFEKGISLVYAGQKFKDINTPSLFDRDLVASDEDREFFSFFKHLIKLKKSDMFIYRSYEIVKSKKNGVIEARYNYNNKALIGIFNIERKIGEYSIDLKDGGYKNLIDGTEIKVTNGKLRLPAYPIILEISR